MNASKLIASASLVAFLATWGWLSSTTENPPREEGREAALELRRRPSQTDAERRPDPLVRFASSLTEPPATATPTIHGSVYVPAYSQIRLGTGRGHLELATTLSIHNSSRDTAIVLKSVTYHNTQGELVQRYLGRPVALRPFGAIEVFVPVDDLRGGYGANFIVDWASASPVSEPVIEAVMVGTSGTQGYSFVSHGRSLR